MLGPLTGSLGPIWFPRHRGTYEQKLLAGLSGIVAYWPLTPDRWSEGAGGILDVSGNGRHGTNNGATPDAVDGPSAAMGRAPYFDGANAQITAAIAGMTNAQGTIATWINWPANAGAYRQRICSVGRAVLHVTTADQKLNISYYDGAFAYLVSHPILTGQWYSAIYTWETPKKVVLYVNGPQIGQSTAYTAFSEAITSAVLGDGAGDWWRGYSAHALLLDHAATADERALINDPNG